MGWKRALRDAGILVAFSGAFYFVVIFVNRLDGSNRGDGTGFSYTRKQADVMLRRQDWQQAAVQFKKLTDKDPYDGRAWFMQARSYDELRRNALREVMAFSDSGETNANAIQTAQRRANQQSDLAIEHYLIAMEFARYRADSLYQIAAIECRRGNLNAALERLEEFVEKGYSTRYGIVNDRRFGIGNKGLAQLAPDEVPTTARLHSDRRFWDICKDEMVNYSGR